MFKLTMMTILAMAAVTPKEAPIKSVCEWNVKNLSAEQAARILKLKKAAKCPEAK